MEQRPGASAREERWPGVAARRRRRGSGGGWARRPGRAADLSPAAPLHLPCAPSSLLRPPLVAGLAAGRWLLATLPRAAGHARASGRHGHEERGSCLNQASSVRAARRGVVAFNAIDDARFGHADEFRCVDVRACSSLWPTPTAATARLPRRPRRRTVPDFSFLACIELKFFFFLEIFLK